MLFSLSKLERASFRGVPFLYNRDETIGGRKTVTYEFPLTFNRVVADNGGLLKVFNVTGRVKGARFIEQRDRLIAALEQKGDGKLILPLYGEFNVTARPYTINQTLENLGEAVFSMVFEESTPNIFPTTTNNNQSLVNRFSREVLENAENLSANVFEITDAINDNLQDAADIINNFVNALDAITLPFNALAEDITNFNVLLNNFEKEIFMNVTTPSNLFLSIKNLFIGLDNLTSTPGLRFSNMAALFQFPTNYQDLMPTTASRIEKRDNRQTLESNIALNSLALAYNAGMLIDYQTEDQVNNISNTLETQYDFILKNNNLELSALDGIKNMRVLFQRFINEQLQQSAQIIEIKTEPTSLTALVYQYYGDLSRLDLINDLNKFPNPSNISGTIKILTQ